MVSISQGGLQRRGLGEDKYLAPLLEIAGTGVTLADRCADLAGRERTGGGTTGEIGTSSLAQMGGS